MKAGLFFPKSWNENHRDTTRRRAVKADSSGLRRQMHESIWGAANSFSRAETSLSNVEANAERIAQVSKIPPDRQSEFIAMYQDDTERSQYDRKFESELSQAEQQAKAFLAGCSDLRQAMREAVMMIAKAR